MVDILTRSLAETDPEVHSAVAAELGRQQATLEMIASENFAPVAVMRVSILAAKHPLYPEPGDSNGAQ